VFTELKQERNLKGIPLTVPYSKKDDQGRILTIIGNPDLGLVATMMLGVKNPSRSDPFNPKGDAGDDGSAKCTEIWFNELRLSGLDEGGGTATLATVNVKLADLGNISLATKYHSIGFGQIEQRVDQRFRDEYVDYDFTTNIEVGKFIPKKAGFRIPFYGSYAQKYSTPQYDPYQLDIKTKDQLALYKTTGGDTLNRD
jgi:cell surface protein SprA